MHTYLLKDHLRLLVREVAKERDQKITERSTNASNVSKISAPDAMQHLEKRLIKEFRGYLARYYLAITETIHFKKNGLDLPEVLGGISQEERDSIGKKYWLIELSIYFIDYAIDLGDEFIELRRFYQGTFAGFCQCEIVCFL